MPGGFIGGAFYGLSYLLTLNRGADAALSGAVGLVILGASIGSLSALVQGVLLPASVKVMRGWQEGREYPLDKPKNSLGRDEHVDIALFLSGPGMTTLPIEIFSYIQWQSSPVIAAITTVQIVLIVLFGLVVERLVGLRAAMRL